MPKTKTTTAIEISSIFFITNSVANYVEKKNFLGGNLKIMIDNGWWFNSVVVSGPDNEMEELKSWLKGMNISFHNPEDVFKEQAAEKEISTVDAVICGIVGIVGLLLFLGSHRLGM